MVPASSCTVTRTGALTPARTTTLPVTVEYGPIGVRANMVCLGWVYTDLYGGVPKEMFPFDKTIKERNPIRRWGEPSDVEGIAAYLMSDAASYHTGDVMVIDGGTTLLMP